MLQAVFCGSVKKPRRLACPLKTTVKRAGKSAKVKRVGLYFFPSLKVLSWIYKVLFYQHYFAYIFVGFLYFSLSNVQENIL